MDKSQALILWFDQVSNDDVSLVGGKNASLGEMYRLLQPRGVRIPNGFIITARGYQNFVTESGLDKVIAKIQVIDIHKTACRKLLSNINKVLVFHVYCYFR